MTHDLTLYHFPRTHSTRVRWWLEEAGVPYRSVSVDIRHREQDAAAFRELSPLGHIPVLVDGSLILRESLAICLHLGFRFPEADLSPPVGSPDLSGYLQWLSFGATQAHQAVGSCFAAHRARHLGLPQANETRAREMFDQVLALYETRLSDAPYLAGDGLTGADLFNASLLAFADSIGVIPASGHVRAWLDRLTALPSYARALAHDEPGANETAARKASAKKKAPKKKASKKKAPKKKAPKKKAPKKKTARPSRASTDRRSPRRSESR